MTRSTLATIVAVLLCAAVSQGQVVDQVVLVGKDLAFADHIARFDRKLGLLGLTKTGGVGAGNGVLGEQMGIAMDGQGRYWIPFDALNDTKLLRMEANGALILPSVNLQHNPVFLNTTPWGTTYALTRVPLLGIGPLYGVSSSGTVLGSSFAAPQLFYFYPDLMEVTPSGEVWLGGEGPSGPGTFLPFLVRIDPSTGAVLDQQLFPNPDGTQTSAGTGSFTAAADGSFWAFFDDYLTHIVGLQVAQQSQLPGIPTPWLIREDGQGNVLVQAVDKPPPFATKKVMLLDGATLAVLKEFHPDGLISLDGGFALGATGEELFVSGSAPFPPYPRRLWRFSLVTGTRSSVDLSALGVDWDLPMGDPTGFLWANVKDQQGDADGDGATNRTETLAGSNPFDATSRPEGPKVYISFAPTTNALVLTWLDPDGLIDSQGGLDLSTLSVTIGNFGNVFYFLLPFATGLDLSADMTKATLTLGALPLPANKKWEVEATVADLTGATAWDWQVTPPGDL